MTYVERALKLIEKGYTPIPLRGKVPQVEGWQRVHVTPSQVQEWDKQGLFHNIGLVCGEVSGNLVVIDFDSIPAYDAFCAKFPALVETYTVLTGSGRGKHCYYKVRQLPESKAFLNIYGAPDDAKESWANVEFKANGKQVVIPPSIHPDTHQPYTVERQLPVKVVDDLDAVMEWAQSLKPREWRPPAHYHFSQDEINPAVKDALRRHFEGQNHKPRGEWINCSCPNTTNHKHGDKQFSFGYNVQSGVGHCYVCGSILTKNLCQMTGIDYAGLGGLYERVNSAGLHTAPNGSTPPPRPVLPTSPTGVITRAERLTDYILRVFDLQTAPEAPPVLFPLKVLHRFGGMAHVIKPGKLVGIAGVSGTGKTSLLETMVDSWLRMDIGSFVWSPEWTPDEFVERAIQRYGGPTVSEMWLHEVYKDELARGVNSEFIGQALTPEQQDAARNAVRLLRAWEGNVAYIDNPTMNVTDLGFQLPDMIAKLPFRPRVLVIDYAQLMHAVDQNDITMYDLLMRVKAACAANRLVGVVASQVTKESSKNNTRHGDILDAQSARFVNDDPFNVFITINAEREKQTGAKLPTAILNIAKNSLGIMGKVRVSVNWSRLTFSDEAYPNQIFEENGS